MSKSSLAAIAAALWGTGFAFAAGLAWEVSKPIPPVASAAAVLVPLTPQTTTLTPQNMPVIVLPEIEIRGTVSEAAPPKKVVRCTDWKPLLQGSGSVQICE